MKNYEYFTNLAAECEENPNRASDLITAFHKLAQEKGDDQSDLVDLFNKMPSTVQSMISHLIAGDDYRYLYAYYLINKTTHFRSRSLSVLRSFINNNNDADDWDAIEELLTESLGLFNCEDCNELEYYDYSQRTYSDSDVCRDCTEETYRWSDHYDCYVHENNARWALDEDGDEVCIHEDDDNYHYDDELDRYVHHDYEPPEPEIINRYHSSKGYQRTQQSPWTKLKKRYIGVELEVEIKDPGRTSRKDKAKLLHEKLNDGEHGKTVFFENDGSLNNGFEIITQPMGLDKHKELWQWLSDREAVRGLISHNTTTSHHRCFCLRVCGAPLASCPHPPHCSTSPPVRLRFC